MTQDDAAPPGTTWTLNDPDLKGILERMASKICFRYPELRDDVLQETWYRLTRLGDLPDGQKRELCSSFVWKTLTHVRNEMMRKNPREIAMESSPRPAEPDRAVILAIREAIRDCFKRLPRTRRRPVFLKYVVGFKYAEIAARLGCSVKTAENQCLRGLAQLRQCLEAKGVTP